ncbi:MAG: sugar ABC transporter substrate-binding protein [Caldisericia bacterium]|nr:sugar ABC transporter substrate-binding protein [Caldisericia bacterium]
MTILMILTLALVGCKTVAVEATIETTTTVASVSETTATAAETTKVKGVIGYVPQSSFAGETSLAYYKGTQDAAEALGYEFVVVDPNFDGAKQVEIIENFLSQPDIVGLVVHPIDSKLIIAGVEKANQAGIPVVSNVSTVDGGKVVFTVTMDLNQVGQFAAEAMVKELEKKYGEPKGVVISIGGPLSDMVSNGRGDGMNSVLSKYPNIKVIHRAADWNIPKAEAALRDLLTANPDADGLLSYTDFYDDGLAGALTSLGKYIKRDEPGHIIWTSVDGMPDGLKRIKEGYMDATADSACETYGQFSVKYLVDFINGKSVPELGDIIEEENATWSPAEVIESASGPVMQLQSFLIDYNNVNDTNINLWGNHSYKVEGDKVVYGE